MPTNGHERGPMARDNQFQRNLLTFSRTAERELQRLGEAHFPVFSNGVVNLLFVRNTDWASQIGDNPPRRIVGVNTDTLLGYYSVICETHAIPKKIRDQVQKGHGADLARMVSLELSLFVESHKPYLEGKFEEGMKKAVEILKRSKPKQPATVSRSLK